MAEKKASIIISLKDKASKGLSKISNSFIAVGNAAKKAVKIGLLGFTAALGFSARNALKQEEAVSNLTQTLINHGIQTKKEIDEQIKFAQELQKVSTFGDEQILVLQDLLAQYGLTGDELKKATKATLDMASATGTDLKAAATLMGKAFKGETGTLSRYGIIIEQGLDKSKKFNAVINEINNNFGGAAQARTKSYSGQLKQLWNRFGDLTERLGSVLLPLFNDVFIPTINKAITGLEKLATSTNINILVATIKKAFLSIKTNIQIQMLIIEELIKHPFKWSTYKAIFDNLLNNIKGFWKNIKAILKGFTNYRKKLLKEEEKDEKTLSEKITEIRKNSANKRAEIEAELQKKLANNYDIFLSNFNEGQNKKKEKVKETNKEIKQDAEATDKAIKENHEKTNKAIEKDDKRLKDAKKKMQDDLTAYSKEISDEFLNSQGNISHALENIIKKQIGGIIDAWAAGEIAKATLSAPLSLGASLLAIAPIVAAQVSAKAALGAIHFQEGGVVPGNSYTGDKIPAFLNSGEEVLTLDDRKEMIALLRSIDRKINNANGQTISIQVDGREIARAAAKHIGAYSNLNNAGGL